MSKRMYPKKQASVAEVRAEAEEIMSMEFDETNVARILSEDMKTFAKDRDKKLEAKIDQILRMRVGKFKSVSERIRDKSRKNMQNICVPGPKRVAERLVDLVRALRRPLVIPEDPIMPSSREGSVSEPEDA